MALTAAGLLAHGLRALLAVRRRDIAKIDDRLESVDEHLEEIDKKLGIQNGRIGKLEARNEEEDRQTIYAAGYVGPNRRRTPRDE